jgi:hypothetical protein
MTERTSQTPSPKLVYSKLAQQQDGDPTVYAEQQDEPIRQQLALSFPNPLHQQEYTPFWTEMSLPSTGRQQAGIHEEVLSKMLVVYF